MTRKYIAKYLIIATISLFLLNLMLLTVMETQKIVQQLPPLGIALYWPFIKLSIVGILFGMLIEWNKFLKILQGHVDLSWLFWVAIVLLILGITPPQIYVVTFGSMGDPYGIVVLGFIFKPLYHTTTSTVFNVLTGILLVRSLYREKTNLIY